MMVGRKGLTMAERTAAMWDIELARQKVEEWVDLMAGYLVVPLATQTVASSVECLAEQKDHSQVHPLVSWLALLTGTPWALRLEVCLVQQTVELMAEVTVDSSACRTVVHWVFQMVNQTA